MRHWVDPLHKEKFISELKAVKESQKYEELSYSSTADTCERRALFEEYKRDVGFMQLQLESKDVRCYSCDMSLSTFKHGGTPKLHRAAVHDIDVQWQRRTPQPPAGRVRGLSTNGRFGRQVLFRIRARGHRSHQRDASGVVLHVGTAY